jgi:hypothetical protein
MIGAAYARRLLALYGLLGLEWITEETHYVAHQNLWLIRSFDGGTAKFFSALKPKGIVEGIVLKNMQATLEECNKESANGTWSVKCRLATKNYAR